MEVITCGQRKLFAFLWADIQGQFNMTSLKEETTRKAPRNPEAEVKNEIGSHQ